MNIKLLSVHSSCINSYISIPSKRREEWRETDWRAQVLQLQRRIVRCGLMHSGSRSLIWNSRPHQIGKGFSLKSVFLEKYNGRRIFPTPCGEQERGKRKAMQGNTGRHLMKMCTKKWNKHKTKYYFLVMRLGWFSMFPLRKWVVMNHSHNQKT